MFFPVVMTFVLLLIKKNGLNVRFILSQCDKMFYSHIYNTVIIIIHVYTCTCTCILSLMLLLSVQGTYYSFIKL